MERHVIEGRHGIEIGICHERQLVDVAVSRGTFGLEPQVDGNQWVAGAVLVSTTTSTGPVAETPDVLHGLPTPIPPLKELCSLPASKGVDRVRQATARTPKQLLSFIRLVLLVGNLDGTSERNPGPESASYRNAILAVTP
jgi:hypothetical protein